MTLIGDNTYFEDCKKLVVQFIVMLSVTDEETGGFEGIRPFIASPEYKALNVGFALDEGLSSPTDDIYATYQDRRAWCKEKLIISN